MKQSLVINIYLVTCMMLFMTMFILTPFTSSYANSNESDGFIDGIRSIWYLILPPKDYYKPFILDELDLSQKGLVKTFKFKHKNKGNHSVGIYLSRFAKGDDFFAKPSDRYKLKLKTEITFYVKDSILLSKVIEDYGSEAYGPFLSPEGGGLIFVFYKTPRDLPINETITCKLKIIEPDKYLNDMYGPAKFYIKKQSDK